uniref:Uncharacterized protein n=1 Tax=Nelumbo nucifera TaxID=4432 RepID=A0A822YSX2_NELNU|nr:TPA_asm: hypothetical protein HUJ06_005169 [Nelumbo nucifera]
MKEMFRVLKPGSRVSILDFNKSTEQFTTTIQEWMIDNVVVPVASNYNLAKEYTYLKSSIREFLTGKVLVKINCLRGACMWKLYRKNIILTIGHFIFIQKYLTKDPFISM